MRTILFSAFLCFALSGCFGYRGIDTDGDGIIDSSPAEETLKIAKDVGTGLPWPLNWIIPTVAGVGIGYARSRRRP